jgi:hypothetical protein
MAMGARSIRPVADAGSGPCSASRCRDHRDRRPAPGYARAGVRLPASTVAKGKEPLVTHACALVVVHECERTFPQLHDRQVGRHTNVALSDRLRASSCGQSRRTSACAAALASVRTSPLGGPQVGPPGGAVLDRRCARRPHHRAGRDGRVAPPGVEQKNGAKQEGKMPSDQIT